MKFRKLGLTVGFVAAAVGSCTYLADVLQNPEKRGGVGDVAIKALDLITPETYLDKYESSKARIVSNSLYGEGKFNQYLDSLLGEKGKDFHNPRFKEDLYKISQELKKISIDDMQKLGLDEDELRGFFLYVLSISEKKYIAAPQAKETLSALVKKTLYAMDMQHAENVAYERGGSFVFKFTGKEVWGKADILLGIAFPRTDFQKDEFNQLIAKQYLMQNFQYKEEDLSQAKLVEAAKQSDPLETFRFTDKARFLKIDGHLNCFAAFTATAAVAGRGVVIGIDVTKGAGYFSREVNKLIGNQEQAQDAINKRVKFFAQRFMTDEGPEQIAQEFYICGKSYGHHFN